MTDSEAQEDELLALESIFEGEGVLSRSTVTENSSEFRSGRLEVSSKIPGPSIKFSCQYLPEEEGPNVNSCAEIHYLPPVVLSFVLGHDYPSKSPPKYTLTCSWLDRVELTKLSAKLDEVWLEQEGQEILYVWSQFIQEEMLQFFGMSESIELNQDEYVKSTKLEGLDVRVVQDVPRFSDILPLVLGFDEDKKRKAFDSTLFQCNICFTERYGKDCIEFKDCGHVYCKDCIKSYFDIQIKDGNMKALNCPEPQCESEAYPAQIKSLVSAKDFERYEKLLLQTTLDTMKDITYCPRKFCQSAVLVEADETIGICPACRFSFCPFCKLSYHGVEPCKLKQSAIKGMCSKYKEGDAQTKKELETKYGAKVLQTTLQNIESEEWIFNNSKNCPGCSASIEKTSGCNKMTCYKCKCHFCWLCMHRLSTDNPYIHYNTSNSKCFNKLFQGSDIDGDFDDEMLDLWPA